MRKGNDIYLNRLPRSDLRYHWNMEKQVALDTAASESLGTVPRKRTRWPLIVGWLLFVVWCLRPTTEGTWFPLQINHSPVTEKTKPFSWDNLQAKPYLDYHDCYHDEGSFKCARLELPLDYWNGTTNATTGIAIIKKPAAVPVTHPQYGGPILFNPGGPGGSGVYLVLGAGDIFRQVIDSEDGKYFDYIGFDPRGIGESRPLIRCLEDELLEQSWGLRIYEEGVIGASDAAFGRLWSISTAMSKSCSLPRMDGEADIKRYASTASVARDMVEIIERHGEWREKEAKRLLNADNSCHGRSTRDRGEAIVEVPEALKYHHGKEKINYWGFSYGTYLGNTYAAMFPDRINRLIVDGVVDAYDYVKSLWMDNLVDTEKDMDLFYYHCARVGFPTCPLANKTGTTTADGVKNRTQTILQSLYHNPLPVIDAASPEVITYSDIKYIILGALYSPIQSFPSVAKLLADIERGDGEELAQFLRYVHSFTCPAEQGTDFKYAVRHRTPAGMAMLEQDATIAIACSDGDGQGWVTKEVFREYVRNITTLSPSVGDIWSILRMQCIHYSVRPNHRFVGPWAGNTSHPILEIGNTADPVTPGRYAKKMAKGFPGAVALIQDSAGHCSLAAPSKCTIGYVKKYFQTGELPPEDTVCKADAVPFGPSPGEEDILDVETTQVMDWQAGIAKAFFASGGGFTGGTTPRSRLQDSAWL